MKTNPTVALLLISTAHANPERATREVDSLLTTARDLLTDLSATLQNNLDDVKRITDSPADEWTSQLKCTADLDNPNNPTAVDENNCKSQHDSNDNPCFWCDLSALTGSGSGLCVSEDQKSMIGVYWDQLCGASAGSDTNPTPGTPPAPLPVSPAPTKKPTPLPTDPVPAPQPDDAWSNALKCSVDASSNLITDETTCVGQVDRSSTDGKKCVWCPVPLLGGGSCITNADANTVSFLCAKGKEFQRKQQQTNNLRGDDKGWRQLDPSCLSDPLYNNGEGGNDKASCVGKNDLNGNACIWCDGAGVLGMCVTDMQKDYLSAYMDCSAAVETEEQGVFAIQ
eukprot:g10555.t1 g10555   contig4:2099209-2100225(-)